MTVGQRANAAHATGNDLPVDLRLRSFFEPQVEQLGMQAHERDGGVFAGGANSVSEGSLWALQLSESCLVVAHEVVLTSEFSLEEESPSSLCVASISQAGVPLCPVTPPPQLRREENIAVFDQGGRSVNRLRPRDSLNYTVPRTHRQAKATLHVCLAPQCHRAATPG